MAINQSRIETLNQNPVQSGDYILYWMQSAQRSEYNHALELAISKANQHKQPLVVYFGLTDDFPQANLRHYQFMLEGLKEVAVQLKERRIKFILKLNSPPTGAIKLAQAASLVVTDRGYLRLEKKWRSEVAAKINCPLLQVETNVVVPVAEASDKQEYAAYTLRKKIKGKREDYIRPIEQLEVEQSSLDLEISGIDLRDIETIIDKLDINRSVSPVKKFKGGYSQAKELLAEFIAAKLADYPDLSADPTVDCLSHLSPYLHFGQISPVEIAREIKQAASPGEEEFLEQLIVRRELAINFVHYNQNYDGPLEKILPDWAVETLNEHESDKREYIYSEAELEQAKTHAPYWNAAQEEMVLTGTMHGYLRMYWGKKILEWTAKPETAFQLALKLNNKYQLDGRDANSFAGVAWCFGKHDRAWAERGIFGKVRYMNASGLERKFEIDRYLAKINQLKKD